MHARVEWEVGVDGCQMREMLAVGNPMAEVGAALGAGPGKRVGGRWRGLAPNPTPAQSFSGQQAGLTKAAANCRTQKLRQSCTAGEGGITERR